MTLGNIWKEWPCYRCVFPKAPPRDTIQSCSDSGILGPAVGVMGVLMAVETLKVVTQFLAWEQDDFEQRSWYSRTASPTLLLYSAYAVVPFRTIYLKKPRKDCAACSTQATITRESLESGSMDYGMFCGIADSINIIPNELRISPEDFNIKVKRRMRLINPDDKPGAQDTNSITGFSYVLVDVREEQDFAMCNIKGSFNLPYSTIQKCLDHPGLRSHGEYRRSETDEWKSKILRLSDFVCFLNEKAQNAQLYFICRYGNDSQKAVQYFRNENETDNLRFSPDDDVVMDIRGGLRAWSREVDPRFPQY